VRDREREREREIERERERERERGRERERVKNESDTCYSASYHAPPQRCSPGGHKEYNFDDVKTVQCATFLGQKCSVTPHAFCFRELL